MTTTPEIIDLLIEARWIATVDPDEVLKNHSLAIHNGRILAILPTGEARIRYAPQKTSILQDHILIPGLINLHTHAAMSLMRGIADDLPLMEWLQKHIWPTEAAHLSPQFVYDGTRLACAEMLKGGITCFNDMYFFPDAAATAASEFGMRAMLGITTLEFPTPYASDAADYINKGLAVREAWHNNPLIGFCLAPHAPYTVSDSTFERILTLSEQLNLPVHCHIHETQQEIDENVKQHKQRPLARLHKLGILGPNFIGVHAVHLNDDDLQLLADTGCNIAHCPTSNLKLASGFAPVAKMRQFGINVGLGTDGAASNNRLDLFGEMRLAALLAKGLTGDASVMPARKILRMATLNAAHALGLGNEVGSISPGKSADLCAVTLGELETRPCFDPVSHLVNVAGRESVTHVWVAGKCCVDDKSLLKHDQNDLESAIALWQNSLEFRQRA
ncbi:TRZ/ATZ family hydrolase [Ferribacterium limneticum]|uniref:TRZ/ATZ family hydrolase n=1 Tax=Ferribacterium limneticum TaxID=76259 RepID=UPI001CF934ED|nr:TRZ/ATZ family hydrolase [Ferribacterium limneticum]UCV27228.1 TRZ/ATZ family hydrolase [Ferribacterium limneticum]UCV31145.1 TRZ/ATZ family hydrolase [Ferribacterium limneticum]